jgi:multidrug efflux pump subunit AcrB
MTSSVSWCWWTGCARWSSTASSARLCTWISRARLADLGIDPALIAGLLGTQNDVLDAGHVQVGDDYLRIQPTGAFESVQAIGDDAGEL